MDADGLSLLTTYVFYFSTIPVIFIELSILYKPVLLYTILTIYFRIGSISLSNIIQAIHIIKENNPNTSQNNKLGAAPPPPPPK
jgi:hypothetical protein